MKALDTKKLQILAKKYGITSLGVFGSYARGEARPSSDLDLLVEFSKPKGLFELVRIERELSKSLSIKVDLLTKNSLSPYLREHILKEVHKVV